jgi:hypothetical protein
MWVTKHLKHDPANSMIVEGSPAGVQSVHKAVIEPDPELILVHIFRMYFTMTHYFVCAKVSQVVSSCEVL